MDYNKLKYFVYVAKHLNMSSAAQELYISQPALSRHIRDLENELGVSLFTRTNKNLILTGAGKALYEETADFYKREESIVKRVRLAHLGKNLSLSIGFMGIETVYIIPQVLADFRAEHPEIDTSAQRMNWDPLKRALFLGNIDVAFGVNAQETDWEGTESYVLEESKFVIVFPASHPLAGRRSVRISELKGEKFLFLSRDESETPYDYNLKLCREAGFEPKISAAYTYVETLLTMINVGEGIALLSNLAPVRGLDNVRCVEVEGVPPLRASVIWMKGNRNPAVSLFLDKVCSYDWKQ